MNLIDLWNFITRHWGEIVAIGTAIWTIIQAFQLEVLKKK